MWLVCQSIPDTAMQRFIAYHLNLCYFDVRLSHAVEPQGGQRPLCVTMSTSIPAAQKKRKRSACAAHLLPHLGPVGVQQLLEQEGVSLAVVDAVEEEHGGVKGQRPLLRLVVPQAGE